MMRAEPPLVMQVSGQFVPRTRLLPVGDAFGPDPAGVSRSGQSGARVRQAVTVAIGLPGNPAVG